MPSQILMASSVFAYEVKPPSNLNYMSAELLKAARIFKDNALERINMAAISKLVEAPE